MKWKKIKVRRRGVLIVRGVLPREEAEDIHEELRDYMTKNGEDPDDEEQVFYEIYWSKPQVT